MSFQKQVNLYPALAAPGMQAGLNPEVMALPVPLADEDGVVIARFVWPVGGDYALVANSGANAPLGLAARVQSNILPVDEGATMLIPAGRPVAVVRRGDRWVISAAAVTAGQKVFANLTTGALTGAAAGATVAGAVETDWRVVTPAAAGDVFLISNW
ncbi:MAG: hypothetical protein VB101_01180 [Rhodospirillaceae bacterium]|nr:hypothetical protein [Rhodospirillaceae bacterium]